MSSNVDPSVTVAESAIPDEKSPPPPSTAVPPPVRRFPPPCWTQEETLALITAYRDRWYALRRGYLRTADWDAVATAVTTSCPNVTPPKTSAQCRHKMEKLRQRYRAEKQRSLNTPNGRFFSSWFFYDNMDAMENGTTVQAIRSEKQQQQQQQQQQGVGVVSVANIDNGYALKSIIDQNLLKLKIKNGGNVNVNSTLEDPPHLHPNFMFNVPKNNEKSNFVNRVPNGYYSYMDNNNMGSNKEEQQHEHEFGSGFRMKNGISMKGRRTGRIIGDMNGFDHKGGNFVMNPSFDCDEGSEYNGSSNASDGFHIRSNMGVSSSRRSYNSGNVEQQPNLGYSKLGKRGRGVGAKRGRDPMEEMVLSIKLLGEGFIKMEKMKMEMAREVEQMRMEMELKRNEMILESQKQIVDAFVKVLSEVNKNKNVQTVSPES